MRGSLAAALCEYNDWQIRWKSFYLYEAKRWRHCGCCGRHVSFFAFEEACLRFIGNSADVHRR
jgi:hypothetical protein